MARTGTLFLLLWLAIAGAAAAQTFPALTGRIVDQANLLPADEEARLVDMLEALEERTGHQFVIVTVNSLEGRAIEDYGYRLGRLWGIGRAGANDGVLLLVAPNEREVRIEVGYGLEPVLTDAASKGIIENSILPFFRSGDMAEGIVWGAGAILDRLHLSPEEAQRLDEQAAVDLMAEDGDALLIYTFGIFLLAALFFGLLFVFRIKDPVENWGPLRPQPATEQAIAADAWEIDGAGEGGWAGIRYRLRKAWRSLGEPGSGGSASSWSSSRSDSWSSSSSSSSFSGGGGSFGGGGASGRW